ncbi:patatin-like phospholipase family protein [Phytohabitans rumicis]|uniref:Patatin n=1 Tax=Phytohabitans rumicis TaxID=1076125 RepID=A0A6V8LN91_9ACTN|nr:patatin-like phospholipase family protein [Phytohabitans rumicis]GFJ96109.1 patatin [Phytohabitans rumicis]
MAWELGVLTGLADAGVDLVAADLFVGTSAGSVVAAQVTSGVPLAELYDLQLAPPRSEVAARIGVRTLAGWGLAMLRTRDGRSFRRRVGRAALAARTMPEAERRAVIASRLRADAWPAARLLVTAVDTATGEFEVFDRDAGVDLLDAVGASCAVPGVWPPVTIDGRRFMDGGMRSPTNADLARGARRIVVIAPTSTGGGAFGRLSDEVAALRRTGQVVVVRPDRAARRAIGRNVLDPARRAPAARAGRAQAAAVAAAVAEIWNS